jgi:hypothetical protein
MNRGKRRERGKCTEVKRLAFTFSKAITRTVFVIPINGRNTKLFVRKAVNHKL